MRKDSEKARGPDWFSIKQAAEYLAIGEPTVYRWMREGRITYRKVGDSTRFLQQDLDAVVRVFPSETDIEHVRQFCPVCHHTELVEGVVRSTGLIYFQPKKSRFWTLKDSNVSTHARMCARCGAILHLGDTEKLAAVSEHAREAHEAGQAEDDGEG